MTLSLFAIMMVYTERQYDKGANVHKFLNWVQKFSFGTNYFKGKICRNISINTKSSYIELDKFQYSKQGMNQKGYYIYYL